MDTVSPEKRSEIMSLIKSEKNKSTEQRLISILKKYHITGWRRRYIVTGRPDFVFLAQRCVIFVDGCFWHGHSCKPIPEQNREYWEKKIKKNRKRDRFITKKFKDSGWTVLRFWECQLKYDLKIAKRIRVALSSQLNHI